MAFHRSKVSGSAASATAPILAVTSLRPRNADGSRELYAYDDTGNVTTSTNRRGAVINYRYNPSGQLTNKYFLTATGRVDYIYGYDAAGNLTNASSPEGAIGLSYYPQTDWLKRIDYPGGKWFEFEYNPVGRRIKRSDQDGHAVGYVHDPLGRLGSMTNDLGQLIMHYDYDDAGRLLRKTLGNGVCSTNLYSLAGQLLTAC